MNKNRLSLLERFFYKEIISSVLFLFFIFFALYVLIDFMTHLKTIGSKRVFLRTWIEYYLCVFSKRLDILLPFAILIGTMKTLVTFQSRNEIVPLLASGISMKKLLQPLLVVAVAATSLLYVNYQWILPYSLPRSESIQESEFGKVSLEEQQASINEIVLEDTTKLIYKWYDAVERQFHDVFWIRTPDEIYHLKLLSSDTRYPIGKYVDKITRNAAGFLEKTDSWQITKLDAIQFNRNLLQSSLIPPSEQSIGMLYKQHLLYKNSYSDKASEIRGYFFYKLTFPLLSFLAFIAAAPYCMRFRRQIPLFMMYLLGIASIFCLFLLLQSALILAKGSIIPAWLAIGGPWMLLFYFFGKRYATI